MRFILGGLLSFLVVACGFAQVTGQIEAIGFGGGGGVARPDAWVPMVVQLQADSTTPTRYQLEVVQYDLDGDEVVYTRPVDVDNNLRPFWMYFRPQPINGGLASAQNGSVNELQQQLRVYVSTDGSRKRLAQLSVGKNLPQIEDAVQVHGGVSRGMKLVLFVGRAARTADSGNPGLGIAEEIVAVRVDPRDLPESGLGYDCVDAVVWTDADTAGLDAGRLRALEQFVRAGGRLVICQQFTDWQRSNKFGDLLPVRIKGVEDVANNEPLRTIARASNFPPSVDNRPTVNPWTPSGIYRAARAEPLPNAVTEESVTFPDSTTSPFIVRHVVGFGSVTWVAQDLSDPSLAKHAYGWPLIWDKVLGLANDPVINQPSNALRESWEAASQRDLGKTLLNGMNLTGRSTLMVTLAFVFFIAYWLVAGPGNYLYLAARKRTGMSWFIFGAIAGMAVLLTLAVVQLVVRGQPHLAHVSLVRATGDEATPARVQARVGLYIPRSGDERIGLTNLSPSAVSTLTPFAVHPMHKPDPPRLRDTEYVIPVSDQDTAARGKLEITIPYRSTLKKLSIDWTGDLKGRVSGTPALVRSGNFVTGPLFNGTGKKLRNVFVAFRYPNAGGSTASEWMLYLPSIEPGVTVDLTTAFNRTADGKERIDSVSDKLSPDGSRPMRGRIDLDWTPWLARRGAMASGGLLNDEYDDSSWNVKPSIVVLSLFDHLKPQRNVGGFGSATFSRAEVLRRGARSWDVSAALSAGAMIVLAEADEEPLPAPLTVDGSPVEGKGRVVYQFVLPIDYTKLRAADAAENARAATRPKDE